MASFDAIVERYANEILSFSEEDALRGTHWDLGEDARLREDLRFRPTPWGRWILSDRFLANDGIYRQLSHDEVSLLPLRETLSSLEKVVARPAVFCAADPRLLLRDGNVRLSSRELADEALVGDAADQERYATHLPVVDLDIVAASMARGEWGRGGSERVAGNQGWLQVELPGRRLNERMFVARIRGDSMDDGKSGLIDGAYVVFEHDPHGSRAGRNVLVYTDLLGTGVRNWALKKYVGDERDAEGRHERIRLVSLNPDKHQYADIELRPEDDDHVQVLAIVVAPLAQSEYARRPKHRRRVGRRDLSSSRARDGLIQRMRRTLEDFFADTKARAERSVRDDETPAARFVCMDADAGGLHIEAGPLVEIPPFVKRLTVESAGAKSAVLASNLRSRVWRFAVGPATGEYVWSTGVHDELLEEELARLRLPGLSSDSASVFRVDAAGVGQPLESRSVSPGQDYRLLLPPSLSEYAADVGAETRLPSGWTLVEVSLPLVPGLDLQRALVGIGVALGPTAPRVSWVGSPPWRYATSPRGESYPCFDFGSTPTLRIEGLQTSSDAELYVFVAGESQSSCLELPAGDEWLVSLAGLETGRYVVEIVHERARVSTLRLAFAVQPIEVGSEVAEVRVSVMGKDLSLRGQPELALDGDFTELGSESLPLAVYAPALWPVDLRWQGEGSAVVAQLYADRDGELDLTDDLLRAREFIERERLADIEFHFAELGVVRLRHEARPPKTALRHFLVRFAEERGKLVTGPSKDLPSLRSVWIDPIVRKLGYAIRETPVASLEEMPAPAASVLLEKVVRVDHGIVRQAECTLVLSNAVTDVDSPAMTEIRSFADHLCNVQGTEHAILTDGVFWISYLARRKLQRGTRNLLEVLEAGGQSQFEEFLADFASEAVRWT